MLKPIQNILNINRLHKSAKNIVCHLLGILVYVCAITSAQAELGGNGASVEADRVNMKVERTARQNLATNGSYTVHETTLPSGTVVRQYVSNSDVVFAVAWTGPFIPDLKQILGINFDTMVARQSKQSNAGHRSFSQHEADLVIESGGHQRSFVGRAYLISMIPANVTLQEIQ